MVSDDLTILRVNCTKVKLCVLCKMFCKLDDRRKSIATLWRYCEVIVRYFVNWTPGVIPSLTWHVADVVNALHDIMVVHKRSEPVFTWPNPAGWAVMHTSPRNVLSVTLFCHWLNVIIVMIITTIILNCGHWVVFQLLCSAPVLSPVHTSLLWLPLK